MDLRPKPTEFGVQVHAVLPYPIQFVPYFQPIFRVGAPDLKLEAVEVLSRVQVGDLVHSPVEVLNMARREGWDCRLDRHLIRTALEAVARWDQKPMIFLNLHARTLERDPDLVDYILLHCQSEGILPSSIVIEIIEEQSEEPGPAFYWSLGKLRSAGISIALDDFGDEHSNFQNLLRMKPSFVKISGSITKKLHTDRPHAIIFAGLVQILHNLGITVVAEGIESLEVLTEVTRTPVNLVQGFGLSRPMSEHHLIPFLSRPEGSLNA